MGDALLNPGLSQLFSIFEDEKSFETVNIETVECDWFLFLKLFLRSTPNFTGEFYNGPWNFTAKIRVLFFAG